MNRTKQIELFPALSFPIAKFTAEKQACLIKPASSLTGIDPIEIDPLVRSIERVLFKLLPEPILATLTGQRHQMQINKKIAELNQMLPILSLNFPKSAPCTLCVCVLCPSEFTGGVGRFLSDTFSNWLVPGKFLNISCVQSLNFSFVAHPKKFFYYQVYLDVHHTDDLSAIQNNWESLTNEIRLNILSVKHARHIIATKKLSSEQKKAIIEENLSSILHRSMKDIDPNAFDHMHHFFLQINAEEKVKQVKEKQFLPSFEQRPKAFQREIFNELKHFVLLFGEKFTALHTSHYVSRLISYQYLFRKSLKRICGASPDKRHLSVKLMKTQLNDPLREKNKTVLGIFGVMNVLRENEVFEEKHLFQAIRHAVGPVRKIENSFILDRRSHDPIRLFYIEIEKKEGTPFDAEEINKLQKNLPREIKESIENVIHPVFMPRNEEEIMRNILLLSQQLKYVSDLPQVIISFDAQDAQELIFRVILLRILKENTPSVKECCSSSTELTIRDIESKQVGILRKKHRKQANVFKVSLNKKKFLRKDFSIDLFKARQALSSELNKLFKGIRDFNGGILSKQQEAFIALRHLLKETDIHKDFLLENFFYSLTPPLHQSLRMPSVLKALFLLHLEAFEANFRIAPIFLKAQTVEDQLLIVIASPSNQLKEILFSIVNTLQIPTSDLSFAHLSSYDIHCFGYIYQNRCASQRTAFYSVIFDYFKKQSNF